MRAIVKAKKARIKALRLDSLTIRRKMAIDRDSFKMAINAKKVVYLRHKEKARQVDFKNATAPKLDSAVLSLYPDQGYIDTAKWQVMLWRAGLLVTDATRSYHQDTALAALETIVELQTIEKDSITASYEELLKIEANKGGEELQYQTTLTSHYKSQAGKYKKQRNRILTVIFGGAAATIGGGYAYYRIRN